MPMREGISRSGLPSLIEAMGCDELCKADAGECDLNLETIILDVGDNGVATLTLNRPEALNAFNRRMTEECKWAWEQIRENAEVRAVVLRGAKGRAFSTGRDTREAKRWVSESDPWDQRDPGEWLAPKQNRVWKPVICAVNGMAAGGAFYWINESDIVICSEDAQFFDPHVTFGRIAAVEPVGLLGRIPIGEVMRIALMGNDERVSAQTALRIGLVSEVVANDSLHARAAQIAATIAENPAVSTQGTVRAIWESRNLPPDVAIANALKFPQIGNSLGMSQIDAGRVRKKDWTLR